MKKLSLRTIAKESVAKFYNNEEILNSDYLLEEYFKAFSNDFDGLVYPEGTFKEKIEIMIACGPVITKDNNSVEKEIYIVYCYDSIYLISIFENNRLVKFFDFRV